MQIDVAEVRLEFLDNTRLEGWWGPQLRGSLAYPFKEAQCRHDPELRRTRYGQRCHGCEWLNECEYGSLFEPENVGAAFKAFGRDAVRPLVLAPQFPNPLQAGPGRPAAAEFKFAGPARAVKDTFLDFLRHWGPRAPHVPFRLRHIRTDTARLETFRLPRTVLVSDGCLPRLRVELRSPLFLRVREKNGRREPVKRPEMVHLLRSSLTTVRQLLLLDGTDFAPDAQGLVDAAREVPCTENRFETFKQVRATTRGGDFVMEGVTGSGTYEEVPTSLVPWLAWGGRLHVGDHRAAGAGSWHLIVE